MQSLDAREGVQRYASLPSPLEVIVDSPRDARVGAIVEQGRKAMAELLDGRDDRLAVIVGPCSVHDPDAALTYAEGLAYTRERFSGELELAMRVYFEKPRTTVGWKGFVNDPFLDGSHHMEHGLRVARLLLHDIGALGVPCATEFLDPFTPAYLADLISWGAIGARTTESQVHREIASGLPMPVGFKNGTDGTVQIAVDAMRAAAQPHCFTSIDIEGRVCLLRSAGNPSAHLVLRGGRQPNFDAASVAAADRLLAAAGLRRRIVIDASHANSNRQYRNQILVCRDVAAQIAGGSTTIAGIMIESNLFEGRQDYAVGKTLEYGKSITDACIAWPATLELLELLAEAVRLRRRLGVRIEAPGKCADVAVCASQARGCY